MKNTSTSVGMATFTDAVEGEGCFVQAGVWEIWGCVGRGGDGRGGNLSWWALLLAIYSLSIINYQLSTN
jgi:hypothetical protein